MKKIIFSCLTLSALLIACNGNNESKTATASTIKLPYEASYSTDFTNNVSDSDLLVALNSYKYWENGDLKALRSTMGDSMSFILSQGYKFNGLTDSLMKVFALYRDSLSAVSIKMEVWLKNHSVKDGADWINVWYNETDTYKTGKVDSANYEDDNLMKNGKIVWVSSHRQTLK